MHSVLSSYNLTDTTVSGISSGAYMAVQYHVAFSETVSGAGVFAGGPYYCARGSLYMAESACMYTMLDTHVNSLVSDTKSFASKGQIDAVENLRDDNVFIFSGAADNVVHQGVVKDLEEYYSNFMPVDSIEAHYEINAGHTFPTMDWGNPCDTTEDPWISDCNFSGAGKALKKFYGADLKEGAAVPANLFTFDQSPYIAGPETCLSEKGYLYVPTACQAGEQCHLHVSFHGCEQGVDVTGTDYVEHTELNDWAEANDIVVLYPQVYQSHSHPYNPKGCWDWWGYAGEDYPLKTGVQMKSIKAMVDAVHGK